LKICLQTFTAGICVTGNTQIKSHSVRSRHSIKAVVNINRIYDVKKKIYSQEKKTEF